MKVTIRKRDFCGDFIPQNDTMHKVGYISNGSWVNEADMCNRCFDRLRTKEAKDAASREMESCK